MFKIKNGLAKIGVRVYEEGINFAIVAKEIKSIKLNIFNSGEDKEPYISFLLDEELNKTGDIWHIFIEGAKEKTIYTWTVDEIYDILDPYALYFTNNKYYSNRKAIALKRNYTDYKHLNTDLKDTIIYETHIKFFTKDSSSGVKSIPGTYSAFKEKIPYLKKLGITAVEFLPIYEWDNYSGNKVFLINKSLRNIWGYNPINFFALTSKYASDTSVDSTSGLDEFKDLVSELHKNGIEVILDVVYNHTAESGEEGEIYNFKALSKKDYYIFDADKKTYSNYSGCGNTVNCNNKITKDMIIDSLLYWYLNIGIDGFRFDLAAILGRDKNGNWLGDNSLLGEISSHPILSHAKLISESWDLAGYFVGSMPSAWSEWNGIYRDTVRKFVKGEDGIVSELIKRMCGSEDIFYGNSNAIQSSINFITCHDGFTMYDLVSYNKKHNLSNGENNLDGGNDNHSYNYGEEGETSNLELIKLRKQQIKNMMLILLISKGVPMICMGDEMGRTKLGNNNSYCQDNYINWVDWERANNFSDITNFVENMIKLRKKYNVFRKKKSFKYTKKYENELTLHGTKLKKPDLNHFSKSIAYELNDSDSGESLYIVLNMFEGELKFELPQLKDKKWHLLVDTSLDEIYNFNSSLKLIECEYYTVKPKSCLILVSEKNF